MSVQDAFIDIIGGPRVSAISGRQKGSPRSYLNPPAAGGMIMRRDDGRKNLDIEGAAATVEERRCVRRHCQRLPLTMSVFNQGAVMQAELVSYGQDGICAETGHRVLPGTSIHLRIDICQAADVGKAILQGLRTTALGEVKWCRALGQGRQPLYCIGIRYYPYY
jgi:hypothetical protein